MRGMPEKESVSSPENPPPQTRNAGGKINRFYSTTGESDFLLISEADEAEAVIAALMASSAAGMISHVSTARAWTGAEFKGIAERAAKAAKAYRPPGMRHTRVCLRLP